jgi:BlaI family transcriptional regulator, penicillinase repressor
MTGDGQGFRLARCSKSEAIWGTPGVLPSVHGVAVYEPAHSKVEVLGPLLRRLVRGILEVDGVLPASAFSGSQLLTEEDLAELEQVLNTAQEDEQ